MTVEVNDSRKPYPGNGVGTIFTGPRLFNESTLSVLLVDDATGAELDPGTYTVTGVGNAQSTVTMDVAPPLGTTLVLERTLPIEQSTDFTNQQTLLRRVVEATFDQQAMMLQQIDDEVQRSFRLPSTSIGVDTTLPTPVALRPLVWNAGADALENGDTTLTGDLLLRGNLATTAAGAGSDLVRLTPPDASALGRSISAALSNAVMVTWYATDAQLAIDATAATQAAIDYAISSGRKAVHFPGGREYRFGAASAPIDPGVGDITFSGDGMHTSVIVFEEGTTTGSILDRKNLFRNTDDVAKGCIEFRGLGFRGTWSEAGYVSGQGGATMLLNYYDEIVIDGCRFENLRSYVMANEFIRNVRVMGCTFDKCARDMVRFRSSFNVQVIGNRFAHCDDDAVALHSNTNVTGGDIREGIVVSGNLFEDCPAVQIIGGRMVKVTNNILRRCKQNGILVYTAVGVASEGDNAIFGIDVSNNDIFDMLNDAPFSAPVSQVIGIYSRDAEGGSSTSGLIPGQNNPATGNFVLPWNHRNTAYTGTVASVAPPYFIRVQNNTISRTLPAVGAYSTYGYGLVYAGDGPQDPAVTDAAIRPDNGIIISGQSRRAIISGNIISHVGTCIRLDQPKDNFCLDDVVVSMNSGSDFANDFVRVATPSAVRGSNLRVVENTIDGDPYHTHANRGAGGTWAADTSPSAINCTSTTGIRFARNKIRNVARAVDNGGSTNIHLEANVIRCQPAATGFSTSNRGVGNVPNAGDAYSHEFFDCNPTSATYGQLISTPVSEAAAQPAAGTYVRGHFVRSISGTALYGWYRLTTGTAHVAGTDWKTVVLT